MGSVRLVLAAICAALGVVGCGGGIDEAGPDASLDHGATSDAAADIADVSADASAASDVGVDSDGPREGDVADVGTERDPDASTVTDGPASDAWDPRNDGKGGSDPRADGAHLGEIDAHWQDADFGACTALPPLPPGSSMEARLWFSSSRIVSLGQARMRDDVIYAAANPPFRLDARALSLCLLPGPTGAKETTQDILAPAGSSLVVIALGSDGPRRLLVSADDGRSWSTARDPGIPPSAGHSAPCALAAPPTNSGVPTHLFATYGGSTVDVSENGGLDWTRAVEGASTSAGGFVVDTAGETLWFVSEIILDRVGALWVPLSASGPLASTWKVKGFSEWDSNTVYRAIADPFDPHALYLGGAGRLGYLTTVNGDPMIDIPWTTGWPADPTAPITYVFALWADPARANHVVWGGIDGGGPARLLESTEGGRNAQDIPLEGLPEGLVTSVIQVPGLSKLVILVRRASDAALAAYVLDR